MVLGYKAEAYDVVSLWRRRRCPEVSFLLLPQIYCRMIDLHACGVFLTHPSHGRAISNFLRISEARGKLTFISERIFA